MRSLVVPHALKTIVTTTTVFCGNFLSLNMLTTFFPADT